MPSITGVLCMKKDFSEGEDYVLFEWSRKHSSTAKSFKADFFGVLYAANGVAHTLAGAPARCLHLDIPNAASTTPAMVPLTAAYLDFTHTLWVIMLEGVGVSEASACVAATRLMDTFLALCGPGLVDQGSPQWGAGHRGVATQATLRRTMEHLGGGDFEYNVIRPEWLALAFVSSESAASRGVGEGAATWEFRGALLRLLDTLEEEASGNLTEAVNQRTLAAMDEFLGENSSSGGERGDLSLSAGSVTPAITSSSSSTEGFPLVLSPAPKAGAGGGGAAAAAPQQWPTNTQKISCLRRLRLSVVGSAVALLVPGSAPTLLVERIPHNATATLLALGLATMEDGLFGAYPGAYWSSPAQAQRQKHSLSASASAATPPVGKACHHVFSPPPPPPPVIPPPSRATAILSPGAPPPPSGGSMGMGMDMGGAPPPFESDGEEAHRIGSQLLQTLCSPCDVLASRGVLLSPGAPPPHAHSAMAGKLHLVYSALPLPPFPAPDFIKAPPPGGTPRLPQRVDESGVGRGWGGASSTLTHPHILVALLVLQPPSPEGDTELPSIARFADLSTATALTALEPCIQKACASVAGAGALAHLGGLLRDVEKAQKSRKEGGGVKK